MSTVIVAFKVPASATTVILLPSGDDFGAFFGFFAASSPSSVRRVFPAFVLPRLGSYRLFCCTKLAVSVRIWAIDVSDFALVLSKSCRC